MVITLLLAVVLFLLSSGFTAPEPATRASIQVDTDQRTAFVEARAVDGNADELEIVVDGELQRTWSDVSAGSRIPLFCLQPGDQVTIRQRMDDGRTLVVTQHVMEERSACRFNVAQPSGEYTVTPINWRNPSASADSFYSYGRGPTGDGTGHYHGHLDPDFVESDESYMFFYEYDGEVALIFLHDSPASHEKISGVGHDPTNAVSDGTEYSDTGGGAVDLELDGEPSEADWVVQDDANDFDDGRTGGGGCDTSKDVCWDWTVTNTDGGIFSGGFKGDLRSLEMDVVMYWNDDADHWQRNAGWNYEDIDEWILFTGTEDGGTRKIELEKSEDAEITVADD